MAKYRVLIAISTLIIMTIFGTAAIMFARGYRVNLGEEKINIGPTGLLVANSEPKAAQVYVNGKLETATDNTLSLAPETYEIEIKKEGFQPWKKQITIEQEAVTQIDAFLIPNAPSLTALTFQGAVNPVISSDKTKIAYVVPPSDDPLENEKAGLWVIEFTNLPLGFNRDPRQITDGDLTEATFEFSPDGREMLLYVKTANYLLDLSKFTPRLERELITEIKLNDLKELWKDEETKRLNTRLGHLEDEIEEVFLKNALNIQFSPDENRILYTASGSASLIENVVQQLPGSSTQNQERQIQDGSVYVYDIREDRNFKVGEENSIFYWLSNSLNLVQPTKEGINILDYDGTNQKTVLPSGYEFPHAYAATNTDRLLILTGFASSNAATNLYWLSLK